MQDVRLQGVRHEDEVQGVGRLAVEKLWQGGRRVRRKHSKQSIREPERGSQGGGACAHESRGAFGRRLAQLVARRLGLRRRRQELWQKARAEKA